MPLYRKRRKQGFQQVRIPLSRCAPRGGENAYPPEKVSPVRASPTQGVQRMRGYLASRQPRLCHLRWRNAGGGTLREGNRVFPQALRQRRWHIRRGRKGEPSVISRGFKGSSTNPAFFIRESYLRVFRRCVGISHQKSGGVALKHETVCAASGEAGKGTPDKGGSFALRKQSTKEQQQHIGRVEESPGAGTCCRGILPSKPPHPESPPVFPGLSVSGFPWFFTYSAKPCPSVPALPERGISRGRLRGVISRKGRMLRLVCVTRFQPRLPLYSKRVQAYSR